MVSKKLLYTITVELDVKNTVEAKQPLLHKLEGAVIKALGSVEGISRTVEMVRAELSVLGEPL